MNNVAFTTHTLTPHHLCSEGMCIHEHSSVTYGLRVDSIEHIAHMCMVFKITFL